MEQTEVKEKSKDQYGYVNSTMAVAPPPEKHSCGQISPQAGMTPISEGSGKSSCRGMGSMLNGAGATTYPYVYALGRIMARFPTMGVEKEFVQATGRTGKETAGLTNQKTFHSILAKRENRYLVRKMCWVLTIEGIDTYILQPRDSTDFDSLVEAIRPAPSPMDIDVIIGMRGPIAPPEMCNGLMVPVVAFDQIYSFDRSKLIEALKEKRPENISEEEFTAAAEELLDRITQMTDNAGATDEHRVVNYLSVRYDAIYAKTAEMHGRNFSLTALEVRPSRLSGVRKIVDVIFSYTQRETDVTEKFFVRVDVTEEFPFLVTKLSPYYDR
ncbi:MAG: hypothetical protein WA130_15220 [Candidatus Methanoperedens sp.]